MLRKKQEVYHISVVPPTEVAYSIKSRRCRENARNKRFAAYSKDPRVISRFFVLSI